MVKTPSKTASARDNAEHETCYEFTLAKRIVANAAPVPSHQIIGLCAEPRCGGSKFIEELKTGFARAGYTVRFRDFTAHDQERATRTLVRFSNGLRSELEGASSVVFFEALPPSDEAHVLRQARAIRKASVASALVVVTVLPEAEQLLEELEEAVTFTARDLAVDVCSALQQADGGEKTARATHGIASLVDCLRASGWTGREGSLPPTYFKACASVVAGMLRPSLSRDELSLRLLLFLLGRGDLPEAASMLGLFVEDFAYDLMRLVPFLGVSGDLLTFDAIGSDDLEVLRASLDVIRGVGLAETRTVKRALEALIARGDFERAALVAGIADEHEAHDLVLRNSAGFLNCGKWHLVREAMADVDALCHCTEAHVKLIKRTLLTLTRPSARPALRPRAAGSRLPTDDEEALWLLLEARGAQARPSQHEVSDAVDLGPFGAAARLHLRIWRLVDAGRFSEALGLVGARPEAGRMGGVIDLCLALDEALCRMVVGDVAAAIDSHRRAVALSAALGCPGISSLTEAVGCVTRALAAVELSEAEVSAALATCEKAENVLGRSLVLAVGITRDLAAGNEVQALVRSRILTSLTSKIGPGYLYDVSRILSGVVGMRNGSRFSLGQELWSSEGMGALAAIVESAVCGCGAPIVAENPPPNVLWLLILLSRDFGDVSALIREQMPQGWRAKASAVGEAWEAAEASLGGGAALAPKGMRRTSGPEPSGGLEVSLLGGFSMRVGGRLVPEAKLDRRDAKSVLEYLLLRDRMSARRYEIIAQVWPEEGLPKGKARLYQATSTIRGAIRDIDPTLDVFSISKAMKSIALDADRVTCDVDEFELAAATAIERPDPASTIRAARRANELYGGDLYRPAFDSTGFVATRRSELRSLYMDAMVAGAQAALQTGRDGLAVNFAKNAVLVDELREDAFAVYIRALKASGRTSEASREYERYARRVVRLRKTPPSRLLREVAGDGLGFSARERFERRRLVEEIEGGTSPMRLLDGGAREPSGPEPLLEAQA